METNVNPIPKRVEIQWREPTPPEVFENVFDVQELPHGSGIVLVMFSGVRVILPHSAFKWLTIIDVPVVTEQ